MAAGGKAGMVAIIFGVLLLVVGLVFSDIIIDQVNRQGGKIGCYNASDVPISAAKGPNIAGDPAAYVAAAAVPLPKKVSKTYTGSLAVGQACGGTVAATTSTGGGACTVNCGTVRYALDVYGADSLNNLFTLIYWIVLVSISISMIGGGGAALGRSQGAF